MTYSQDLRQRVLSYVQAGGRKQEAARLYQINVDTIYEWLKQSPDHKPRKPDPTGSRKFDRADLERMLQAQPDLMPQELAAHFKVSANAINYALRVMDIRRKKTLRYTQAFSPINLIKRTHYLKRWYLATQRECPIVYIDETGFAPSTCRDYARAKAGFKVYGLQQANLRPRTSLIGAYYQHQSVAPMLFDGCCNAEVFNDWLEHMLLPCLLVGSLIVMDNATFHKSNKTY